MEIQWCSGEARQVLMVLVAWVVWHCAVDVGDGDAADIAVGELTTLPSCPTPLHA